MPVFVRVELFPVEDSQPQTALKDALDSPITDRPQSSYYGIQNAVEGGEFGYLLTVWASNPESTALPFSHPVEAVASRTRMYTFEAGIDPEKLLNAPTCEIVILIPKEGLIDAMGVILDGVTAQGRAVDSAFGAHPPCVWGQVLDASDTVIMLVGWDNREAHLNAISAEPFLTIIENISAIAHIEIAHTDLTKHEYCE